MSAFCTHQQCKLRQNVDSVALADRVADFIVGQQPNVMDKGFD